MKLDLKNFPFQKYLMVQKYTWLRITPFPKMYTLINNDMCRIKMTSKYVYVTTKGRTVD